MTTARVLKGLALSLILAAWSPAQEDPSFKNQVQPFLAKYCVECHKPAKARGELDLTTFKGLHGGGQNGPAFAPGKPDESLLVRLTEGLDNPKMPPKTSKAQPSASEIAIIRKWVAAGARDDGGSRVVTLPPLAPKKPGPAPIAALAYRPTGKPLALGGHDEVILLDPETGRVLGKLLGQTGKVSALTFSPDGDTLAVASGQPGVSGVVRLYFVPPSGLPGGRPELVLEAHRDVIHALAFSPDGRFLASAGYDRLIKIWDANTGKEIRVLKDHSDSVYSVAFSPNGAMLASGGADRAVKIWDMATGKRLYTLSEAADWVQAVAWHPQGKQLAAAGVDRSIRVWDVTPSGGKVAHSVFAHEKPVTRLAFSEDGATLYSLGDDRVVKAWVATTMQERRTYPAQKETVLSLAVASRLKQIAIGRYDGAVVLLDEATGKTVSEPWPVKPKPPILKKLTPNSGVRGNKTRVLVEGTGGSMLMGPHGILGNPIADSGTPGNVSFELTVPATVAPGVYPLRLQEGALTSEPVSFTVDPFPQFSEREPNDSPTTGMRLTLPASVAGVLGRPGEVDYYRFEAQAGQEVGVQALTGPLGSKLEPRLTLADERGRLLAEGREGVLAYRCLRAGMYSLGIRDRDFRGGAEMFYRLHLGSLPVVTSVYPLGVPRDTTVDLRLLGAHLNTTTVRLEVPANSAPGSRLPVPLPAGTLGSASVLVGEFPEVARAVQDLPVPGTANGLLETPGRSDIWRFHARKGERVLVEVNARRLGSPLDSTLEILDAQGNPVPRATLRCVARTYSTFRDHDSAGSGIRIETWGELAMNDYLLVGTELVKIRELPKNPDDDCQFYSRSGQRLGWLDTTPTHHPLGTPMYKVTVHPPGTSFPPNGFPLVQLPYRNDDGGPGFGKDSKLTFDAPSDGIYAVRVSDSRGEGGSEYAYRLTVRPPQPSFQVSFTPTAPQVWKGGAVPVTVTIERQDGFDGRVDIQWQQLPSGIHVPPTNILPADTSTAVALSAAGNAQNPGEKSPPLKLIAKAQINGQEVIREALGGVPRVVEPGDIVTTAEQQEVMLHPGGESRLTVRIERRNGFKGRIPLEVRGLPYGVRVLDIGLNGILITERETVRTMVLYAEPWVQPTTHPIVVLARREGKNTEHAAGSIQLHIKAP